jgi:large subunit ribosomal protein L29
MKRKDFLKEINSLDAATLQEKANKLAEEQMRLRFKQATKQLDKSHLLKGNRKELARVQTALTQKKSKAA